MVAVKDALVSMCEVHEDADAELVISRMMDLIVSFRANQTDPSETDATEMVCLLDTGEDTQVPQMGDTWSEHMAAGEERVVKTILDKETGAFKNQVDQITNEDIKNDNATTNISSESQAHDNTVYPEDAIIDSVYYQREKMEDIYYNEENKNM